LNGTSLKLTIELVPSTSWWKSLRAKMPKDEWDAIRKGAYARFGYRCAICNSKGRMHCHEVWGFDDARHVQKLKDFIVLCEMCHYVKHIGLASVKASEGELDYNEVVKHFLKVNGCDMLAFEKHKDAAFSRWQERSSHEWRVDAGAYEKLRSRMLDKKQHRLFEESL